MADNTTLNTGSGGDVIATDDISSVKYQRVKLIEGADGVNDGDISATNPLPIEISDGTEVASVTASNALEVDGSAVTQPISAAALPLPSGAATAANQLADGHNVTVDNTVGSPANVQISDGTETALVSATGSLEVTHSSFQALAVTGGGAEATAQRVTIANDSTGVLSVDDNSASLTVDNDDTVSSNNSTATPLGISGNFTGTADDCTGYTSVTCQVFADQDSAADGMKFQFSTDGTNWDESHDHNFTANETRPFVFSVHARYFRVNYTNGTTGQGAFRLQTILHRQAAPTIQHNIADSEDPDLAAGIVKSAVIAQAAGSGDFVPVQATAAGNFKMSLEEVDAAVVVPVNDNSGSLTVDAPAGTPVNVQIGDGTDLATVSPDGELYVSIKDIEPTDVSDTITGAGDSSQFQPNAWGAAGIQITGTWVGTIGFDGSLNGADWLDVEVVPAGSGTAVTTTTSNGVWYLPTGGLAYIRIYFDAYTSGTASVRFQKAIAGGKQARPTGGSGGTAMTDDSAFSVGTTDMTPVGGIYRSARDSVDDNDAGALAMTATRGLYTTIETPAGDSAMDDTADAVKTIGQANSGVDIGDVTINNAAGGSAVNIQDGGNTITVDGTVAATQSTASNLNAQVVGDIAHDTSDGTSKPIKIGGKASTDEPTAVAVSDRVNAWFDTFGRLVTVGAHANPETPVTVPATSSGDTAVIAAPGASVSLHICKGSVHNGGSSVIAVALQENGSATNIWNADLAADGGGSMFDFGERGWKLTANTGLDVNLGAAGDVQVNITEYYIAA